MIQRVASWWKSLRARPVTGDLANRCERCGHPAAVFDYRPARDRSGWGRPLCDPCSQKHLWIPDPRRHAAVAPVADPSAEVPMEVERVIWYSGSHEQMVVLREADGPRRLSFVTGYSEATAIGWALKGEATPRPPTHQAWADTVAALGARVESACVLDRRDDVYLAEVRLFRDGSRLRIDARPTDAIAITLRAGVPFRFRESVLASCSTSEPEPT